MRVKEEQLQHCWMLRYSSWAERTTSSWALLNSELLCELAGLLKHTSPFYFPPYTWFGQCRYLTAPALPQKEQTIWEDAAKRARVSICWASRQQSTVGQQEEDSQKRNTATFEGKMLHAVPYEISLSLYIHVVNIIQKRFWECNIINSNPIDSSVSFVGFFKLKLWHQ